MKYKIIPKGFVKNKNTGGDVRVFYGQLIDNNKYSLKNPLPKGKLPISRAQENARRQNQKLV